MLRIWLALLLQIDVCVKNWKKNFSLEQRECVPIALAFAISQYSICTYVCTSRLGKKDGRAILQRGLSFERSWLCTFLSGFGRPYLGTNANKSLMHNRRHPIHISASDSEQAWVEKLLMHIYGQTVSVPGRRKICTFREHFAKLPASLKPPFQPKCASQH